MTTLALNIINLVQTITGASFGKVNYATVNHGLLKTSKVDGSINPLWSRKSDIRKVVEGNQIDLGTVYKSVWEKRIDKVTGQEVEVSPQPMRGKVAHSSGHKCLCQNTAGTKTYIRYLPMGNSNITVRYELDGQDVTDQMWKYRPVRKDVGTQAATGLTGDQQVMWRTLDVENITSLTVAGVTLS